jgi:hypothetical protein
VHILLAGGTRLGVNVLIVTACSDESTPMSDTIRRVNPPPVLEKGDGQALGQGAHR